MKYSLSGWSIRKILIPIKKILKKGVSVEKLAASLALGVAVGLIPLYGFTTLLIGLIALSLRLDFVAMQIAHYIVYPLQIALLVPFLKLGDILVYKSEFTFSVKQYLHYFKTDFWKALHDFWLINLSAVFIWLILAIPLFIVLYYFLSYLIRKYFPKHIRKAVS
jgi:uncharacterized protein (DUF2062 family)